MNPFCCSNLTLHAQSACLYLDKFQHSNYLKTSVTINLKCRKSTQVNAIKDLRTNPHDDTEAPLPRCCVPPGKLMFCPMQKHNHARPRRIRVFGTVIYVHVSVFRAATETCLAGGRASLYARSKECEATSFLPLNACRIAAAPYSRFFQSGFYVAGEHNTAKTHLTG